MLLRKVDAFDWGGRETCQGQRGAMCRTQRKESRAGKGARLGGHPDRLPEEPPRPPQLQVPQLELGREDPQLPEREELVRDELQRLRVHVARLVHVARVELLEERVLDPEVDVPAGG